MMKIMTDWRMQDVFEMISIACIKYYSPPEHLVVDKIIVLFKGRIVFKQYIAKEHKHFDITVFKLCDSTGDMT
jgi:hypothetical protein